MSQLRLAHVVAVVALLFLAQESVVAVTSGEDLLPWGLPILLLTVSTAVAGWLIAWRRPRVALGWILLAIPLMFAVQGPVSALAEVVAPVSAVTASWLETVGTDSPWSWIPPIGLLLTQLPLRFPTGRLPSPRWRWFSWSTIAAIVIASVLTATTASQIRPGVPNPTAIDWHGAADLVSALGSLLLVPAIIGSVASLFVRYRGAGDLERAQLRWVFWAIATVAALLVVGWAGILPFSWALGPTLTEQLSLVWTVVTGLSYSLIPVAVLFAVLRRKLYSIDRIISRTAAYLVVTVIVVTTYLLVVLSVSTLLPTLSGVGVALATLASAALFLPLLRRVRHAVDRVFNRSQYDAERVVVAFGEHVRTGADPAAAGEELLLAVARTLEPASMGLWVRR